MGINPLNEYQILLHTYTALASWQKILARGIQSAVSDVRDTALYNRFKYIASLEIVRAREGIVVVVVVVLMMVVLNG